MDASYRIRPGIGLRLYLGVFAGIWVGLLVYSHVATDGAQPVVTILMLFTGAAYLGRAAFTKVEVRLDGVLVRNVWGTSFFPWDEVEGFRVHRGLGSMMAFGRSVTALLSNGQSLTMDATARYWAFTGGFDDVTEMSRRLGISLKAAHHARA